MVCASRGNNPPPHTLQTNASLHHLGWHIRHSSSRKGRQVTNPIGRDFNDVVFHSKQADGFMKLGDIKGEIVRSDGDEIINNGGGHKNLNGVTWREDVQVDSQLVGVVTASSTPPPTHVLVNRSPHWKEWQGHH